MKKTILVVVISIFLMTISVSATDLEISPETIEVDLVAGDIVTENITIRWHRENRAFFELSTNITPDDIGISVNYYLPIHIFSSIYYIRSRNTFFLDSNTEILIKMVINTSIALIPSTYIITTNVRAEVEEPSEDVTKADGESYWYPDDYLPDYEPPEIPDYEEPPDDEDEFVNVIYYTIIPDDGLKLPSFLIPVTILVLIIIFAILMLLYIIIRKERRGEKNDKNK